MPGNFFKQIKIPNRKLAGEFDQFGMVFPGNWQGKTLPTMGSWDQKIKIIKSYFMDWVNRSNLLFILTAPFIYALWIPAIILDIFLFIYQTVCFPVYEIPRVNRNEYIAMDRHRLSYLNNVEKFNCLFCGYFNGLISYAREIASRTEQYWCPIKHARKLKGQHKRYHKFIAHEDGGKYREKLWELRKSI